MLLNSLWNGLAGWVWWAEVMGKRACLLGTLQEAGQAGPRGPPCPVPPAPPGLQLGSLLLAMCPVSPGISVWLPGNRGGGERSGQSQLAWMPTPGLRAAGDHLQRSQKRDGWQPRPTRLGRRAQLGLWEGWRGLSGRDLPADSSAETPGALLDSGKNRTWGGVPASARLGPPPPLDCLPPAPLPAWLLSSSSQSSPSSCG